MTFILPGGLGELGAQAVAAWDPTKTGWGAGHLLTVTTFTLGEPGEPGGLSIAPLLAPTSITDTFPTVENPISSGGKWQHLAPWWAVIKVVHVTGVTPNVAAGTQTGAVVYNDSYAYLTPTTWPPSHTDYSVAATIRADFALGPGGSTDEYEVLLRVRDSATTLPAIDGTTGPVGGPGIGAAQVYECNYHYYGEYQQIVVWFGGEASYDSLNPGGGPYTQVASGDVLMATIQGTNITVKYNGTTLNTYDDRTAYLPTGQPGFGKYYEGTGGGDNLGFSQVVVTSTPYTAPTPTSAAMNVSSLATAGTIVGQIPCQHNPTSWSITSATPSTGTTYFSIDSFANVVVQAAGVGNLVAPTYTLTVQATNAFGSNTATVTVTNTGVTGPVFSNFNKTIIDGDGSHGAPLAVRANKAILTAGTTANLRRYFEVKAGNVGENPSATSYVSVGVVNPTWNAATVTGLPLGYDTAGNSAGGVSSGAAWVLVCEGTIGARCSATRAAGDISGVAVDNSGVNYGLSLVWFNLNGIWLGSGTTTFPGLTSPDQRMTALTQIWPACSTDYVNHLTINPSVPPLYMPSGFLFLR